MFLRTLQPRFFNQVCLFLRADNIQSAGVTIHEDIYIYIFFVLDINTEYIHSVCTLKGIAGVYTPGLSPSQCPIWWNDKCYGGGFTSSFTFSAICPSPPGVSL